MDRPVIGLRRYDVENYPHFGFLEDARKQIQQISGAVWEGSAFEMTSQNSRTSDRDLALQLMNDQVDTRMVRERQAELKHRRELNRLQPFVDAVDAIQQDPAFKLSAKRLAKEESKVEYCNKGTITFRFGNYNSVNISYSEASQKFFLRSGGYGYGGDEEEFTQQRYDACYKKFIKLISQHFTKDIDYTEPMVSEEGHLVKIVDLSALMRKF